jgi:hypothetical protein
MKVEFDRKIKFPEFEIYDKLLVQFAMFKME